MSAMKKVFECYGDVSMLIRLQVSEMGQDQQTSGKEQEKNSQCETDQSNALKTTSLKVPVNIVLFLLY